MLLGSISFIDDSERGLVGRTPLYAGRQPLLEIDFPIDSGPATGQGRGQRTPAETDAFTATNPVDTVPLT